MDNGSQLSQLGRRPGRAPKTGLVRLLEQFELQEHAAKLLDGCSHGVLRPVGVGSPPLLLLDEPVSGLDPSGHKLMRDQMISLRETGRTGVGTRFWFWCW